MTFESACIPVPSEVILPFSASLIVQNPGMHFNIVGLTIIGALGNLLGSLIAYSIGKTGGRRFIEKYGKYLLIQRDDIDKSDRFFHKFGNIAVLISRIMPVVRTFISLPAGIYRMNLRKFCIFTLAGSVPFCLMLAWFGYILGKHWDEVHNWMVKANAFLDVLIILLVGYWFYRKSLILRQQP